MLSPIALEAAILCGGKSSRFGSDKALARLPVSNTPLLLKLVADLQDLGFQPMLLSAQPQKYAELGLAGLPDLVPEIGPLGGLLTALSHCQSEAVFFVTCDMPCLTKDDWQSLLKSYRRHDEAVLFANSTSTQPFPAIYGKTLLPRLKAQIAIKDYAMQSFLKKIQNPNRLALLPANRFVNMNTQDDLRRIYELAQLE